ncbi:hypothetical protein PWEIH_08391 [Listeria weihenstephanensis FSL R9-0317]|uniref:DUF1015 family protein n=1 Tax=Listeria weihenstephanensis TaxID=1006155 RepID=A0A1S7FY87_9LIST|nr:DUF1015 family protein [Listeria weihenstephanensis]AQY52383.1 hypothetical protein UE46_16090 [Listeria weihenstephanensis]EUJ39037.1 hypothetical protein PWEIH_08391 [Listeria weihenstephanensis FSL R9-0317]MBC1501488.1 DUF1015 family protein [Listeria weihenstephanensis]
MVKIRAFKAIRPSSDVVNDVASLPYDVLNTEEARELGDANPLSFLHIDKAEIDLAKDVSPYDASVYGQASANLTAFQDKEWLTKDATPKLYLYQLVMNGRPQTGLVTCTAIDDYVSGAIKKHELTREEKELDRIRHVDVTDANTSPIFLTYRSNAAVNEVVDAWIGSHDPVYDFDSFHDVTHRIWTVDDADVVNKLTEAFEEIPALYIADGHHRTESAVKVGLKRREEFPDAGANAEFNFFLSVLFPQDQLEILDYNRVVDVPIAPDFLEQIALKFDVEKVGKEAYKPAIPNTFGMYLDGAWYGLKVKPEFAGGDVIASLDVSILADQVLEPLFGIKDIRRDDRINFVGGIRGLAELAKLVDAGKYTVAFSMYPPTMDNLLDVADAGAIMPPKSTWFEPKLLSGLFVHDLESK